MRATPARRATASTLNGWAPARAASSSRAARKTRARVRSAAGFRRPASFTREDQMSVYAIAVFLHIVGALGLFAALGLEWASLYNLRRVTTAGQVREWAKLLSADRK